MTPPLRELTPETSYGFDVVEFARDILGTPLDPWEECAVIHAGELLPDGSVRFAIIIILVSRQNGKTYLLVVLTLYWLYVERLPMILGTSTKLDYAKESWRKAVKMARRVPALADEIPRRGGVRETNGEQELLVVDDAGDEYRYKIAASNADGGRSLSIDRLILDELRQHHTYEAWDAMEATTSAVPGSQTFALSNAGSDKSIVLNDKRADAIAAIEAGDTDTDICLLEWSAPENADPRDLAALAQANPNLGYPGRKNTRRLLRAAHRAVRAGGDALTGFKTEHMCMRVKVLDPAIDPTRWRDCLEVAAIDLADRDRLAACVDLAPSGLHATLAVAVVLDDGRVRIETVKEWTGPGAAKALEHELTAWVATVRPRVLGWFPTGPAAAVAAKLADRRKAGVRGWPPPRVTVSEIRGEVAAVCTGFAKEVNGGTVVHSGQDMLNAQVDHAERLPHGDAWVFTRRVDPRKKPDEGEAGNVDAVYAVAGAVHLARTLPPPLPPLAVVTARG